MTKREFAQHCQCSWRYRKLLWMIETFPIEEVKQMQEFNEELNKGPRYQDLKIAFEQRLQS